MAKITTSRPPIVTIMGHVDHGKTSLLDKIRSSQVQESEVGGITQSIGAYQVDWKGSRITFIDTPGHHAFAQMRARGGKVADIVVLVVAVDDGVMPQTKEALSHARLAGAQIIVALNKIDLVGANTTKVKKQLSDAGVELLEYGGTVPLVETSAATGVGIDDLLKTIVEVARKLELKSMVDAPLEGYVLESYLDDRRGPVANVLVMAGKIELRDFLVSGVTWARVKRLQDWQGVEVKEVDAGTPVEVLGFGEVPMVGNLVKQSTGAKQAQMEVSQARQLVETHESLSPAERVRQAMASEGVKEILIVIKADSQGALEALQGALAEMKSDKVRVKVVHGGIGNVSESDVLLAASVRAIVLGFGVKVDKTAQTVAQRERVIYRTYGIIYQLIEELQLVVDGEIEALTKQVLGVAKVKKLFVLSDGTTIAGCEVIEGVLKQGNKVEVVRGREISIKSRLKSLRSGQNIVDKIEAEEECGIMLADAFNFIEGDLIQAVSL